jgi:hypothetical protein
MEIVVYNKGQYSLGQLKNGRITIISDCNNNLPRINKNDSNSEYNNIVKAVLTEIDNIEFIEDDEFFTIYDKRIFQSTSLELPIFVNFLGNYRETKKKYNYTIFSDQTLLAANKLANEAKQIIEKKVKEKTFAPIFESFEKKLDQNNGICVIEITSKNEEAFSLFLEVKKYKNYELTPFEPLYIIAKGSSFDFIELKIPKKYKEDIPHFIGSGGKRAKKIANFFNANYIKFVLES